MSKPPTVPGTVAPRILRDAWRMTLWTRRSYFRFARDTRLPRRIRIYNWWTGIFASVPVFFALGWLVQVMKMLNPQRRYYMNEDRTAIYALRAKKGGAVWLREDHACARIKSGAGRELRQRIFAHLLPIIDDAGVMLVSAAASDRLASIYIREMPGLVDVGPAWPRGRELQRDARRPTEAEARRAEQLLAEVCEPLPVRPGPITITRTAAADARGTRVVGRADLQISLFTLRRASPDALRWILAHECAHVTGKDSSLVRYTTVGLATYGAWFLLLASGVLVLRGHLTAQLTVTAFGVVLGLFGAAWVLGMLPERMRRTRRSAARAQIRELRCDLVATRRYGLAAAAAAIALIADSDDRPESQHDLRYSTHPSADLRLATVKADDYHDDPDTAATKLYSALSSPAARAPSGPQYVPSATRL